MLIIRTHLRDSMSYRQTGIYINKRKKDDGIQRPKICKEIKMIDNMRNKFTVQFTAPMTKAEDILLASSSFAELADQLLSVHLLKTPVWDKINRVRILVSAMSREAKMLAEPESLGARYKGKT